MPPISPLTKALMLICTAVFCIEVFVRLDLWFALWPLQSGMFLPWQVVSYGFLHGSLMHLAFNMLGDALRDASLEIGGHGRRKAEGARTLAAGAWLSKT